MTDLTSSDHVETCTRRSAVRPDVFVSIQDPIYDLASERIAETSERMCKAARQFAQKPAALDASERIANFTDDIVALLDRHEGIQAALRQDVPEAVAAAFETMAKRLADIVALGRKANQPVE